MLLRHDSMKCYAPYHIIIICLSVQWRQNRAREDMWVSESPRIFGTLTRSPRAYGW